MAVQRRESERADADVSEPHASHDRESAPFRHYVTAQPVISYLIPYIGLLRIRVLHP